MSVLVADCVSKSFGPRRVLSAGSLRAEAGQVRVVFGRNGIGKSTLIKIAAGLLAPDSGVVHFRGTARLRARHSSFAREGLFYLPDHELLSSAFSLRRQLQFQRDRFQRRSVEEAATLAHVVHLLDRRPHTLSGGELRRAELAMVLVRQPECLLADEPYRGIAPVDHDLLTRLFRSIAADGCAVVVTGHEVPTLFAAADHITWCTSGTTYELGAPEEARAHEEFRRDYLGPKRL
ncbi:MAG: transporter related protein [Gemmatimonadetes bacterium]|nr:transporter related protein [Gemmatimonadota bacterium]